MSLDLTRPASRSSDGDLTASAFDAEYYAAAYPDVVLPREELYGHFMTVGWIEGRNPNPYFDLVTYLLDHPDVAAAGMNPLFHFLSHGRAEGRAIVPAVSPLARSMLALGYKVQDWVGRLRAVVDEDFYCRFLPAFSERPPDPVAHFAYRGWREGLDPGPGQSTARMVQVYAHAAGLLLNPFLAHLEHVAGRYEPAADPDTSPPPGPSPPEPPLDLLRAAFDAAYYLRTHPDVEAAGVDAFEHYFYTGWREGRNPRADFDTAFYLKTYEDARAAGINPFWHFLTVGKADGRTGRNDAAPTPAAAPTTETDGAPDAAVAELVATEFSAAHYLSQYEDIKAAGIDPLHHFLVAGWREGRNPCRGFDTGYYLESNPDVLEVGINPFWHFLVAGRAEGRAGMRPGGYRRRILDAVREPRERTRGYRPADGVLLDGRALGRRLTKALAGRAGLAVALSHDCYVRVIGGTQIFIADEERRFREQGFAYLQLSPRLASLALAEADPDFEVQIVLDGEVVGLARLHVLTRTLERHAPSLPQRPVFVVHSLLGFDPVQVTALQRGLQPARSLFWLHDYTALCEGFNLLRNDLDHCKAPPVGSIACRVCIYGETRQRHLDRMAAFLGDGRFEVVAPSAAAMGLWHRHGVLPQLPSHVHPHWDLERATAVKRPPLRKGPVRVAFVGYPSPSKGWETFVRLAEEMAQDSEFEFLHFAAQGTRTVPEARFVVSEVTPHDRVATQRLLAAHRVDLLAILSPWPETFSYVAHEGLLAGCRLLCVEDSGNVAALVRRTGQGKVLRDAAAVVSYFTSGEARLEAVAARRNVPRYEARFTGTSATLEGLA